MTKTDRMHNLPEFLSKTRLQKIFELPIRLHAIVREGLTAAIFI